MRKIVLSMLVVGALVATSCKGEKKEVKEEEKKEVITEVEKEVEETKKEVSNMVDSALDGVTIPKFEDEKVTEHLKSYVEYAKGYIDANGDVSKITAMAAKGQKLATEGAKLVATLDADAQAKYSKVLAAIMSKMAPATK